MPRSLDDLLAAIAPGRTYDLLARRMDEAISSFRTPRMRVDDWDEYTRLLTAFLRHIEAAVLRIPSLPDASPELQWRLCTQMLRHAYGANGDKAAFERARTGVEGGLLGVLRKLARTVAERHAEAKIRALVYDYWESLTVADRLAAADEYIKSYGRWLSPELTEGSAARLRANLPKVLMEHPRLVQRLQQIGR